MRGRTPVVLSAVIVLATAATLALAGPASSGGRATATLVDVAPRVGLRAVQGAFRFGVSNDAVAMMGTGLCWLDADGDGWLDLYVVNGFAEREVARLERQGGLPRSTLFRNVRGGFRDVGRTAGVSVAVRGTGCAAGDLDGDGRTDLVVTTASSTLLFWNEGGGRFREGAAGAGVVAEGWRSSVAIGDVDGDGRADLYVGGYTDLNAPIRGSDAGFPTSNLGVRDLLFVNRGPGAGTRHARFREVGRQAGIDPGIADHTLGAVLSDLDLDGRLDLVVANDEDPNRLYQNVAWPGGRRTDPAGLGFRFEERGGPASAADPNAGMGIAVQDYTGDGLPDFFVSDSRGQPHAAGKGLAPTPDGATFGDARPGVLPALGAAYTGWGVTMPDLDLDGDLDLVLANGGIPVRSLTRDAQPLQVLANGAGNVAGTFADASAATGATGIARSVGRGVAAADFDNDGRVDIAVASVGGPLRLLRNTGTGGHWLTVVPEGLVPGTRLRVTLPGGGVVVRELQAGSSYLSSEDPRLHVGLGDATAVDVEVRFPDGTVTRLRNVQADRFVRVAREPWRLAGCTPADRGGRSVARVWDETILAAIRDDLPAPTTHARNLFHLSAAMWDAWAAYDRTADGVFVTEKLAAPGDVLAAREAAMSFAAYRILTWRYALGGSVRRQLARFEETMRSLCYRSGYTATAGDGAGALGNRIAAAVIAAGRTDGANEAEHYADETYRPVNEPLIVKEAGTTMFDPTRWQPLALDRFVSQNGLPVAGKVQTIVGAQWGTVRSFALPAPKDGVPIDPGPPAIGGPSSRAYKEAAMEVLRLSAGLDAADGRTMDAGLGARGNSALGTNDGRGYPVNPVTGRPYAPDVVPVGDYGRAIAEFWADGPRSETPPGHWNVLANRVTDAPETAALIGPGDAARLRWDARLYLALNGAVHDAAIAAWGLKRRYDTARPISMIRYLAGRGQSSDRSLPSYDPDGLPLEPGLVEVVTAASSAPGERHAALADHVGEIAVRAWRGSPGTREAAGGVGWILGTRWAPYQRDTFVTPAFPGYVSGHSTFSRAAAEVLTAATGSPFFPGGELDVLVPAGALGFEKGPSVDVHLRSATYYDAADQAGLSRLYGGIHVGVDDLAGRRLGSRVGKAAWLRAQSFIDGTARP